MMGEISFLRMEYIVAGVCNAVLNPLISWLCNREASPVNFPGVIADTLITCFFVTFLVTFFSLKSAERGVAKGYDFLRWKDRAFFRLNHPYGTAWIIYGVSIFILVCFELICFSYRKEYSFACFFMFKTVYPALLGAFVARNVIIDRAIGLQLKKSESTHLQ